VYLRIQYVPIFRKSVSKRVPYRIITKSFHRVSELWNFKFLHVHTVLAKSQSISLVDSPKYLKNRPKNRMELPGNLVFSSGASGFLVRTSNPVYRVRRNTCLCPIRAQAQHILTDFCKIVVHEDVDFFNFNLQNLDESQLRDRS
jgi:hypothetical protein